MIIEKMVYIRLNKIKNYLRRLQNDINRINNLILILTLFEASIKVLDIVSPLVKANKSIFKKAIKSLNS